jgi:hypothetical protein
MAQDDQMKLPTGKTCQDCLHLQRCVSMFAGNPASRTCEFWPSRFTESNQPGDGYAVVELLGRQLIAGKVSDATVDGLPCVRVDIPETRTNKGFSCWFQASAVYSIKPVGEAQALNITTMRESGRVETPGARRRVR